MRILTLLLLVLALLLVFVAPAFAQTAPTGMQLDELTTVAGIAAVTTLVLGLFVKPWLRPLMTAEEGVENKYYGPAMNVSALAIAIVLSLLAWKVAGLTYENVVQAVLTAILGAASAIGGYEVARAR